MSEYLNQLGERAVRAKRALATIDAATRNAAITAIADALIEHSKRIIAENKVDLENAVNNGIAPALIDRLTLNSQRIAAIADSMRDIVALPDYTGNVLEEHLRPNGLLIRKVAVPIGVIAVIFEARPNVTADSAALALKSGNACILRGGKEAIRSNAVMAEVMRSAIKSVSMPEDCVQLVSDTSRETAAELMRLREYIDVLIPRGGKGLIQAVCREATVPVIETGAGTCHTYIDKAANKDMAISILLNAKASRPSVCNACECMLIHKDVFREFMPELAAALKEKNVEIRADERIFELIPGCKRASAEDWGKEYNDYIIAAKVVDSIDEAIDHIYKYGTKHSECIVTDDNAAADKFLANTDAAAVYVNASTRFTDGGEFGFGAEIGISTQKLHARGPLGIRELTSYKYLVIGNGQVR